MNKVNFYSSQPHYFDHMLPIWKLLPDEYKGEFFVLGKDAIEKADKSLIKYTIGLPKNELCLVSGWSDYLKTSDDVIYMEHGIGHSYSNHSPAHSGGYGRNRVVMYLNQNEITQSNNLKVSGNNTKNVIIGTPKMDQTYESKTGNVKPIVCISFHWDCAEVPETRSAYYFYKKILLKIKQNKKFKLVIHLHPKFEYRHEIERLGIPIVEDFSDVLKTVDIYVNDNSSTIYEFMLTGRPVIYLNCPLYRKEVNHGIRFWDYIGGSQVDSPFDLESVIENTLLKNDYEDKSKTIIDKLYPNRHNATQCAVNSIIEYIKELDKK